MGSAMFTAVTGLLAHQRRLDVIANNIANVNTTAYRSSRMMFQDLLSQTIEGGTAPVGDFGGTNPLQIGLGVVAAAIDVDHGQGSLFTTGVNSDLAIQGNGFFVLSDGQNSFYTRDGSFALNAEGILVDPATGMRVVGYTADSNGVIDPDNTTPGDITIALGATQIVRQTQMATLAGNLQSDAADGAIVNRTIQVFDSLGTARSIQIVFTKRAQVDDGGTLYNAWLWRAEFEGTDVTNVNAAETGVLLFDDEGVFHAEGSIDDGVTDTFTARASLASQDEISIPGSLFTGSSIPAVPFEFDLEVASLTQLEGETDVSLLGQDGFPLGVLESFGIGQDGIINGVYTNGLQVVLGQIALASFPNVGGLERVGDNLFMSAPASGLAQLGAPNTGGRGSVSGGVLEMSNVDLGTEFTNMIITQRGFQANARTITTADTMLQEAVNLVR